MQLLKNLKKILTSYVWVISTIIGIAIIAIPEYLFVNTELIIWNLWKTFYIVEIISTILISILFWIFIWATLYKINYFSIKKSWIWIIWWFLWALVSWCPACSITLASYLWLAWLMTFFPYHWIELKILSVFILIYVNYSILNNLNTCSIKK